MDVILISILAIWVTDDSLSCWEKVLKMRSKVMKISD